MSDLLPAESMAMTVAKAQAQRGELSNVATMLIFTVERLDAKMQAVRDFLDNAGFPSDTEFQYPQGYNDAMGDVRRALNGGDDA